MRAYDPAVSVKPAVKIDSTQLSDNKLAFLNAPDEAVAYGLTLDGEICWCKATGPDVYKYLYDHEYLRGNTQWLSSDSSPCSTPLIVRTERLIESPEEREAFERLEREQQINAMAAIARTCATTSSTGIAALLFDAGCRFVDLKSHGGYMETKEKWVIEKTGEKFFFTRWLGDQVHESYAPVSQEVAGIYAAAIVQGFQPPHSLNYLDKLVG